MARQVAQPDRSANITARAGHGADQGHLYDTTGAADFTSWASRRTFSRSRTASFRIPTPIQHKANQGPMTVSCGGQHAHALLPSFAKATDGKPPAELAQDMLDHLTVADKAFRDGTEERVIRTHLKTESAPPDQ
jgi:hypothetical protein